MKKLALIALTAATVSPAFAGNFTGFGVGVEADFNKNDVAYAGSTYTGKNDVGANVVGSYGIAHGNNLVSTVDAKAALGKVDIVDSTTTKIQQKQAYSVGYSLGYTGLHADLMPYAKVNYNLAQLESGGLKENVTGFGWGVGAKYAFAPNLEANVEYIDSKLDKTVQGAKLERDGHNVSAGITYRF